MERLTEKHYLGTDHSVKEAAKSVGVHDTKVSAVCKGNRKTTGGHSFRFLTRKEGEKALEAMKDA